QNFRGGNAAAGLAQGIGQGMQIANQRKQNELAQQQAQRAQEAFELEKKQIEDAKFEKARPLIASGLTAALKIKNPQERGMFIRQMQSDISGQLGGSPERLAMDDISDERISQMIPFFQPRMTPQQQAELRLTNAKADYYGRAGNSNSIAGMGGK